MTLSVGLDLNNITEGTSIVPPIAGFSDTPNLFVTAVIDWGDGKRTTFAEVVQKHPGEYEIFAPDHVYADEGTFKVTMTVDDGVNPSVTVTGMAVVADAPLTAGAPPPPITGIEGTPINPPSVTFTDANPNAKIPDFTAMINWGDGSTSPGVIVPSPNGAGFIVTGPQHIYQDEGSYTEIVTIKDIGGSTLNVTLPGSVTIVDADHLTTGAATFVNNPITLKGTVTATFTDNGPSQPVAADLIATVNWGDGTITTGTLTENHSGTSSALSVSGSHIDATTGQFPVTVTLADDGTTNSVSEKISANVVGPNYALLQQDATNFLLAQYATDPAVAEATVNGPLTKLLKDLADNVTHPMTSTDASVPTSLAVSGSARYGAVSGQPVSGSARFAVPTVSDVFGHRYPSQVGAGYQLLARAGDFPLQPPLDQLSVRPPTHLNLRLVRVRDLLSG